MLKSAFSTILMRAAAAASPHVEARFPTGYRQLTDFGVGIFTGIYIPLSYHYNHDCLTMSIFSASQFISLHKVFNERFQDQFYNIGYGIDNGVEAVALMFWMWRSIETCSH
jgi:hypothetical protein